MEVADARLYEQCVTVFNAMTAHSARVLNEDPAKECVVYRGYTTYLLEQEGISISNYTPIMRRLRTMGCIEQLVRGGRGTPSEWKVIKPPNRAAFARGGQRWVAQNERISDLEERVAALESQVNDMSEEAS
jgi:hypothetical protein